MKLILYLSYTNTRYNPEYKKKITSTKMQNFRLLKFTKLVQ